MEAEFEAAHRQDAVDGAFTQFAGQGEDICGDRPKLVVLLLVGFRHAGAPLVQAMTGSGAASARRRGDWK